MNTPIDRITIVQTPSGPVEVHQPGYVSFNSRLTQDKFERYETYFETALANWPKETSFAITPGLSANTLVARLRDARLALKTFPSYNPTLHAKLGAIPDLTISLDSTGTRIWFRHLTQLGRPPGSKKSTLASIKSAQQPETEIRIMPDGPTLKALCNTLSSKLISGPFLFRGRVSPMDISSLESTYDIAFAYDEVTDVTTII